MGHKLAYVVLAAVFYFTPWFTLCTTSPFSQSSEHFQHVVHTKGGPLYLQQDSDVSTHPHLGRALHQLWGPAKKELPPEGHVHHSSSLWGPLATHTLFILSLAPEAQVPEVQDDLLAGLHDRSSAVTSFLPPYSWVVLASTEAAAWLAQQPNTLLVAYPPALKIAPEWHPLLDLIASNDTEALLKVMDSEPLEHSPASLPARTHEEGGDPTAVIGPLRTHEPMPRGAAYASAGDSSTKGMLGGVSGSSSSKFRGSAEIEGGIRSRAEGSSEGGSAKGNREDGGSRSGSEEGGHEPGVKSGGRKMLEVVDKEGSRNPREAVHGNSKKRHFLIQVSFPELGAADRARLGLGDTSRYGESSNTDWVEGATWSGAGNQIPQHKQQQQQQQQQGTVPYSPARAAAEDWDDAIKRVATACGAHLLVEHSTLMVSACSQDLAHVLAWLAARPTVRWLSPSKETMLHNRAAAAAVQLGGLDSERSESDADSFLYWQAGLDGSGQMIGSGDSGLNMQSCYFRDDAVPFIRTGDRGGFSAFFSTEHRKVQLYVALRGDLSDADGHGSHTSGTLAGSQLGNDPTVSPKEATGMAPGARLSFLDLASGRINGVVTPADLSKDYYPFAYREGARVHSDSWGSTESGYDTLAADADRFLWDNQDFISVFSAGNQGDSRGGSDTSTTLSSPSVAKNVISVGATLNAGDQVQSSPITAVQMTVFMPVAGVNDFFQRKTLVVQGDFGGSESLTSLTGRIKLVGASPRSACVSISSSGAVEGRVVLAERGECKLEVKLRQASDAGAAALIITNDRSSGFFELSGSSDSSIPVGGVPRSVGRYLWDAAAEGGSVFFSERPPHNSPYDQLASFSSSGPTADGRIKPDIVAPGRLTSASIGDETCSTNTMQGTSMAAPVVGGSAAIVRQYFAEGFYPSGTQKEADAYPNPSGALVKAVLLAGASHLKGNVENENDQYGGLPLEEAPSGKQGFGRVDFSQALPLQGKGKDWRMQVIDKARIKQGETHKYCATATGGPFRVVLAWHDFPGDPAAGTVLVNNLDLELRAAGLGGYKLRGNGRVDDSNNVEAVLLESLPRGNVAISVKATRVTGNASPQPYSLVVLGQFSGILQGPDNPVGGGDSRNDECVIALAEIDREASTPSLTSERDLFFAFRTESGVKTPAGFQCRLVDEEAVAYGEDGEALVAFTDQLHAWRACSSPAEYKGMPDHVYRFQVRAAEEDVADGLTVRVDSSPPETTISSSFDFSQENTSADSIKFEFEADDATAVTFQCRVELNNGPEPPYFRTLPQELTLNQQGPCTSPVRLLGLYHGDWTFRVTGTDAAGNEESISDRNLRSWKQRYTEGTAYTRLANSPPPLTNKQALTFKIYSFVGKGDQTPEIKVVDPSDYTFDFEKVSTSKKLSTFVSEMENDTVAVTEIVEEDGDWEFSVQLKQSQGGGLQSDAFNSSTTFDANTSSVVAGVTVDTTPPIIVIDQQPEPLQTSTNVKIEYSTDPPEDDVVTFECRWLSAEASAPNASASNVDFQECKQDEPGTITRDVMEGYWVLQIRGTDRAGNVGDPTSVDFQTDLTAPELEEFSAPGATNGHTVEISYNFDDGEAGSGYDTDMVVCTFAQQQAVADARPIPDNLASEYKPVNGDAQQPCPNPARYAVTEGRYSFRLQVSDRAGNTMAKDHIVVVDMQPPISKVDTPVSEYAEPPEVTITFTSRDLPEGSDSGVQVHRCLLQSTNAATASNGSGRRRLSQDGPPRIANGPEVAFGEWQECAEGEASGSRLREGASRDGSSKSSGGSKDMTSSSRTVMYQHLRSGDYEFRVRSVDASGNVGEPSDAFPFEVDEDLSVGEDPRDAIQQLSDNTGLSIAEIIIIIVVICAVVFITIITTLVAIVVKRRRDKRLARENAFCPAPIQPGVVQPYSFVAPPYTFAELYPQSPLYEMDSYYEEDEEEQLRREEEEERVRRENSQAYLLSEAQARQDGSVQMRAEEQARMVQAIKLSEEQARREEAARRFGSGYEEHTAQAPHFSPSQDHRQP